MFFANALITNETLRVLGIADNDVGDEAVLAVTTRLKGGITDVSNSVCGSKSYIKKCYIHSFIFVSFNSFKYWFYLDS